MKHIQPFVLFEAKVVLLPSSLTKKQEKFLNKYTTGTWSVNPTTGLVDVQGDFDCSAKRLESFPGISFGHVSGNFSCGSNRLTSLAGAPQTVGGFFDCSHNKLQSLEGAPQTVDGDFWCIDNQLQSLEGAPQTVNGDFRCSHNKLQSLEGAPQTVDGDFWCIDNQLQSLEGAPQTVNGDFRCDVNQLQSLVGAPQELGRGFYCGGNQLTSLEGAPQTVGRSFRCDEFQLDSGKWNMEGWVEVLNTGTPSAQKLILTLPWLGPDWWNQELQRDPGKTVHLLATAWNHMPKDMQSAIKIPKGYEDDFELFSGFDELGLF
jgi:hypothetical protein